MENMEYYKVLTESLKLEIEEKLLFIYNLMKKVVIGIEEAIEKEKNLMLSPSVNHKTLWLLETYSEMLSKFEAVENASEFDVNIIASLMLESNKISIEEKIMIIYNLIESLKYIMISDFSKKFKLEDIDKSRFIEINKNTLDIVRKYIFEYTNSIKSARILENKLNSKIDLIV